jgi:hypothetical protein
VIIEAFSKKLADIVLSTYIYGEFQGHSIDLLVTKLRIHLSGSANVYYDVAICPWLLNSSLLASPILALELQKGKLWTL